MAAGMVRLERAAVMEAEWSIAVFQRATDVVGDSFQALRIPSSKIRLAYTKEPSFELNTHTYKSFKDICVIGSYCACPLVPTFLTFRPKHH